MCGPARRARGPVSSVGVLDMRQVSMAAVCEGEQSELIIDVMEGLGVADENNGGRHGFVRCGVELKLERPQDTLNMREGVDSGGDEAACVSLVRPGGLTSLCGGWRDSGRSSSGRNGGAACLPPRAIMQKSGNGIVLKGRLSQWLPGNCGVLKPQARRRCADAEATPALASASRRALGAFLNFNPRLSPVNNPLGLRALKSDLATTCADILI